MSLPQPHPHPGNLLKQATGPGFSCGGPLSVEQVLTSYKVYLFPHTCSPLPFLLPKSSCIPLPDTCRRQETSLQKSCKASSYVISQAPCSAYKISFLHTLSRSSCFSNPMMLCYLLAPHAMFGPRLEAQALPARCVELGPACGTRPPPGPVVKSYLGSLLIGILFLCPHPATLTVPMLSGAGSDQGISVPPPWETGGQGLCPCGVCTNNQQAWGQCSTSAYTIGNLT